MRCMRGKTVAVPVSEMLRSHVAALGDGGQRTFADELGISEATVSRWVHGQLVPDEKWVKPIARALKEPEPQVRAAIAVSQEQRRAARFRKQRDAVESEEVRRLRELVEELSKRLQDVEAQLSAAEHRPTRRAKPPAES